MNPKPIPPGPGKAVITRLLIVILAAPVCLWAGEPEDAKDKVTAKALELVKQDFPYQPPAKTETKAEPETKEENASTSDVVKMAPYVVDESRMLKDLNQQLEEVDRKTKAEQFSFTKGGLIYKNERVEVGLKRYRDPLDPNAQFDPQGRFDFFRLKF